MSHFLIVGPKFSSLTQYLSSNGHTFTQLKDIRTTNDLSKTYKDSVLTDFSTTASIELALSKLTSKPDGVLAIYENYIRHQARIADILGLPGIPIDSAEACTDKFVMRSLFAKAPIKISPDFSIVNSHEELIDFAGSHEFPLILKPTSLAKSLLVTKNDSLDQLLANYDHSLELMHGVYKKYAPGRDPQLLVEEYLDGSIHSVDAFVDENGEPDVLEQVVDYETGYDIGYDDNFHYSRILPSRLSTADQKALRECARIGAEALGMKNSAAHIEIIMTKNGPRIVEIGARNGGYRERMHSLANGIDMTGALLDLALGRKPIVKANRNDSCAVLELFPRNPGKFSEISNTDVLATLKSFNYISIKAKLGEFMGKAADGYKMCGVVILHNSDSLQFAEDLEYVRNNVEAKTTAA